MPAAPRRGVPFDPELLQVADRLLDFIQRETGHPGIVCDDHAAIVRATVRSRIGQRHSGAERILSGACDEAAVTAEEAAAAGNGVKEGYSCAIAVGDARIGTFGVTGPLAVTKPVARVAAMVLASWVHEVEQRRAVREVAGRVFASVDRLGARAEAAVAGAAADARASGEAGRAALERIGAAADVARGVQRIAMQSRILSINGSVEATRAGAAGRSFGVVAKDMTRLAEETKEASVRIEAALHGVDEAVHALNGTVARSARSAAVQGEALAEASATVAELRSALERLEASIGEASTGRAVRGAR